jgi:hypothetical protein
MDLLEDTDLRRGHGSEAVHGFESYIYISVDMIVHILVPIMTSLIAANFEKHIFLSQTDLTRTGIISNCYNEMFEA